jgi:ribulose-phosphate 3-epimerase
MNDKRVYISPSILNANVHYLKNEIEKISSSADFLHLDIMDNIFVPNFTFTLEQSEKILKYTSLPVDAHLMVANPDFLAPQYAQIGCFSVTFHFEAAKNPKEIIQNIVSNGARAAIAIKPSTPFEAIEKFLPDIYMLVIMTVEPGFGGQKFMVDQLPKIEQARKYIDSQVVRPIIQVDGGISESTISKAAKSGANCFVSGSAIYNSSSPSEMVEKLRNLAALELTRDSHK